MHKCNRFGIGLRGKPLKSPNSGKVRLKMEGEERRTTAVFGGGEPQKHKQHHVKG